MQPGEPAPKGMSYIAASYIKFIEVCYALPPVPNFSMFFMVLHVHSGHSICWSSRSVYACQCRLCCTCSAWQLATNYGVWHKYNCADGWGPSGPNWVWPAPIRSEKAVQPLGQTPKFDHQTQIALMQLHTPHTQFVQQLPFISCTMITSLLWPNMYMQVFCLPRRQHYSTSIPDVQFWVTWCISKICKLGKVFASAACFSCFWDKSCIHKASQLWVQIWCHQRSAGPRRVRQPHKGKSFLW